MSSLAGSAALFARNRRCIPGGCTSLNRKVIPEIAFVRGQGASLWDVDGNRYIDYHAAFAPYLLGHADPGVDAAVRQALDSGWTLTGTGTTPWEGRAAELLVECVPTLEKVQFANTGSEATYHALRLSRAFTGRAGIVVMQGGYNGWHDEVACNVMTPLEQIGPRVSPGEYPFIGMSAGMAPGVAERVHVLNFNDLDSVEWAFQTYPVACLMTEPILQNIGVVKPEPGYLAGLRALCDRYGVVLVFDEVKTGFRHAPGGYQSLAGVTPDLTIFGKAIANGYPLGAIGGKAEIMDLFDAPDPAKRVMIAGTYNGHPVPMAAAIAVMERLLRERETLYPRLEALGARMEAGLNSLFRAQGVTATVARQGSAFCAYFMDHAPPDWHDIAEHHDMERDLRYRRALIAQGVYHFPLPTKQGSISAAHTEEDIRRTLEITDEVLKAELRISRRNAKKDANMEGRKQAFERDGFAVIRGLFSPDEVAAFKQEIRRVLEAARSRAKERGEPVEAVGHHGVFVGLAANSPVFREAARDPRLLDALEPVLGPNIEFLSDKVVFKTAEQDFGTPWHQDWPYWKGAHKVSVWIALDPATPENGCLKLLPGSHQAEALHDGDASDGKGFGHRLRPGAVDESRAVVVPCAPGDAVIFHDRTLHASFPNTTGQDRWALISTYRSASEPDLDYEWAVAAEIVRGSRH
jgi:glutamate-1-semialdehyde 2,1-aminomutase